MGEPILQLILITFGAVCVGFVVGGREVANKLFILVPGISVFIYAANRLFRREPKSGGRND